MEKIEPTVEIKSDEGIRSIGLSEYFKHSKLDTRYVKLLSFTVIISVIAVYVFIVLKQRKIVGYSSKEFSTPEFSREVPLSAPNIVTHVNSKQSSKGRSGYPQNKINVLNLRSISDLPLGTEGKAILVSGGTDGLVKAKVLKPIIVDSEPLIPENSILFGNGKSGEDRLYVEFRKVILPTGEVFKLIAQAFDTDDKIQGLKGAIVGSRTKKMGMAMGLGFLGGMTDGLRETSGSMFMAQKPTVKDAALAGASKAALDQSEAYLEEMKKSPNIVQVKSGTEFYIIVDEEKKKEE